MSEDTKLDRTIITHNYDYETDMKTAVDVLDLFSFIQE
jgi:hypothetical protein